MAVAMCKICKTKSLAYVLLHVQWLYFFSPKILINIIQAVHSRKLVTCSTSRTTLRLKVHRQKDCRYYTYKYIPLSVIRSWCCSISADRNFRADKFPLPHFCCGSFYREDFSSQAQRLMCYVILRKQQRPISLVLLFCPFC